MKASLSLHPYIIKTSPRLGKLNTTRLQNFFFKPQAFFNKTLSLRRVGLLQDFFRISFSRLLLQDIVLCSNTLPIWKIDSAGNAQSRT